MVAFITRGSVAALAVYTCDATTATAAVTAPMCARPGGLYDHSMSTMAAVCTVTMTVSPYAEKGLPCASSSGGGGGGGGAR